jgi:hypothetical protein
VRPSTETPSLTGTGAPAFDREDNLMRTALFVAGVALATLFVWIVLLHQHI